MNTLPDLVDSFVSTPEVISEDPETVVARAAGYAIDGLELFEERNGSAPESIAGWDLRSVPNDHRCWIRSDLGGRVRRLLEEGLRRRLYLPLPIAPVESPEDPGASVTWYALPVECMACGDRLDPDQRPFGLCPECARLRAGVPLASDQGPGGWVQTEGLHGPELPRTGRSRNRRG